MGMNRFRLALKVSLQAGLLVSLVAVAGCESKSSGPKKPTTTGTGGAATPPGTLDNNPTTTGTVTCDKTKCDSVAIEVFVPGTSGSNLQVRTGSRVNWSFEARSTEAPSRSFKIFNITASPQPSSMRIDGAQTTSVRVDWTPVKGDSSTGTITVSVRDVSMCEAKSKSPATCSTDFATTDSWDQTRSLSWQITDATGSTSATGLGTGGGGFMSILMSVGMPLIQQMMGGGQMDLSSIMGSMSGMLTQGTATTGGGLGGLGGLLGGTTPNATLPGTATLPQSTLPQTTLPSGTQFPTN